MEPIVDSHHQHTEQPVCMREWLLMQAQLQLDYARTEKAIVLLKLVESMFGKSATTSLMLCKAWFLLGDLKRLEKQAKQTLMYPALTTQQLAAVYFCMSKLRWQEDDKEGAKKAHSKYLYFINSENDKA